MRTLRSAASGTHIDAFDKEAKMLLATLKSSFALNTEQA